MYNKNSDLYFDIQVSNNDEIANRLLNEYWNTRYEVSDKCFGLYSTASRFGFGGLLVGGGRVIFNSLKESGLTSGYIMPQYRGRKLQKYLIKERLKYCKEQSSKVSYICVDRNNLSSFKNIIACGFRQCEPHYLVSWSGENYITLRYDHE